MLPTLPRDNLTDYWSANSEYTGQFFARKCARPNCQDVSFSEFGKGMSFASDGATSVNHFSHVVGVGSEMKMCGVDTNLPVAVVKNPESIGDWSMIDAVGGVVSSNFRPPQRKKAVTVRPDVPCPVPASTFRWVTRHEPRESFGLSEVIGALIASSGKRIPVSLPTLVVGTTPVSSHNRSVAARNRACHPIQFSVMT